jgi:hypothetical protein
MKRDWQPEDVVACWTLVGGGLTPLFWTHVNPYGQFNLQMDRHLDLGLPRAVR